MENANKVVEIASSEGWGCQPVDRTYEFTISSPAGQDFNVYVAADTVDALPKALYEWWEGFDCSEQAYNWLGPDGHGINGAPHDMKDVYEDMEWCQKKVYELSEALEEQL